MLPRIATGLWLLACLLHSPAAAALTCRDSNFVVAVEVPVQVVRDYPLILTATDPATGRLVTSSGPFVMVDR